MAADLWNPRSVLDIRRSTKAWIPKGIQCIGKNYGNGATCSWIKGSDYRPEERDDVRAARLLINDMATQPIAEVTWDTLHRLASLCLCRENHITQAHDRANEWAVTLQQLSDVPITVPAPAQPYRDAQWSDQPQQPRPHPPGMIESVRQEQRDEKRAAQRLVLEQNNKDLTQQNSALSTKVQQLTAQVAELLDAKEHADDELAAAEQALAAFHLDNENHMQSCSANHAQALVETEQRARDEGAKGFRVVKKQHAEEVAALKQKVAKRDRKLQELQDNLHLSEGKQGKLEEHADSLERTNRELLGRVEKTKLANTELRVALRRAENRLMVAAVQPPSWPRRVLTWFRRLRSES